MSGKSKKARAIRKSGTQKTALFPWKVRPNAVEDHKERDTSSKKAIIFMLCGNVILLGSAFSLYALKTQFQHYYSAETLLPMQGLNGILTGALMVIGALYIFWKPLLFIIIPIVIRQETSCYGPWGYGKN